MVVTKGMYTYTLKVTRHLGHFFYLTTASRSVCRVDDNDYGNDPWMGSLGRCSDNV